MDNPRTSLFLAGDALMTLPWSHVDRPEFTELVAMMRQADATIVNLETVIHEHRGYAQADSGGTWMASPPQIARELAWAGVDMVAHANNHAFDYGCEGVLETLHHVAEAGILLAGSGSDLQEARAPSIMDAGGKRIAHLSMAATFVAYGRASRSRPDMRGRPGVNPLRSTKATVIHVTPRIVALMRGFDRLVGRDTRRYLMPQFLRFGLPFQLAERPSIELGRRLIASDRDENLASIGEAAAKADTIIVSIHAHNQSRWLRKFIVRTIAAGAGIVVVHGVHEVRGIELIEGCPVFYGLGDFVYQAPQIGRQPSEAYERLGLDDSSTVADIARVQAPWSLASMPKTFEGAAARLDYAGSRLEQITLVPLDLQFGAADKDRGRPQIANPELGRKIIADIARLSKPMGTGVRYDGERNVGIVEIAGD